MNHSDNQDQMYFSSALRSALSKKLPKSMVENVGSTKKEYNVYLAGKVSGLTPEQFHRKFEECRKWLESVIPESYNVIIPMDFCEDDWDWKTCMDKCVPILKGCTCIYMMPDWEDSKGATCEYHIAESLGIRVVFIDEDTENGDYCFHTELDGFTNRKPVDCFRTGDIVVYGNIGPIFDFMGTYGFDRTLYTFAIDNTNTKKPIFFEECYFDKNKITRLANEYEKNIYIACRNQYVMS